MLRSTSLFIVLAVLLFPASHGLAVQNDLENYIPHDSPAFLVIHEPSEILDRLETSVFFQNRHYLRAMEILTDERFSLETEDRLLDLENQWYEVRDALAKFDQIAIVVHEWRPEYTAVPQFTIVFSGSEEDSQELDKGLASAQELLSASEDEKPGFFANVAKAMLEQLFFKQVGNFVIVSNIPEQAERLASRLQNDEADDKFRSLAKHRSYQQLQNILDKRTDTPQIRGYLAPKNFPRFVSNLIDRDLWSSDSDSIAGVGFQVVLQQGDHGIKVPEGNYIPVMNWDLVSTHPMPATELGKVIESSRPLGEIPQIPFKITTFNAHSFDQESRFIAREELYRDHTMAEYLEQSKFYSYGLFQVEKDFDFESILPAFNESIEIFHSFNGTMFDSRITMERVNDLEAMKRLLEQRLKETNKFFPDSTKLVELPNDHGQLFGRTESAVREQAKKMEQFNNVPATGSLSDEILAQQYEYFLNDEWMIHADHLSMKELLSSIYEEPAEPQSFNLLYDAARQVSDQENIFKVVFRSNDLMMNHFEQVRIWKKHYEEVDQSSMTAEELEELRRKTFKVMESEPDEYGLRLDLESEDDATAVAQQLFATAINETFGTSVRLFSKDEHRMHVFGQVFSLVEECR